VLFPVRSEVGLGFSLPLLELRVAGHLRARLSPPDRLFTSQHAGFTVQIRQLSRENVALRTKLVIPNRLRREKKLENDAPARALGSPRHLWARLTTG